MKQIICLLFFMIKLLLAQASTAAFDLQNAINNAVDGRVSLPGGILYISEPIIIPNNILMEGNNTIIFNNTNDYVFKIRGDELDFTTITQDIIAGGGIPNINPTVTVKNAKNFRPGDYVKVLKKNQWPLRIEFNIVKSIIGDTLTFKQRFKQPFFQSDNVSIVRVNPVKNVVIKDLEITSSPEYQSYGVYAKNTHLMKIENITFKNLTRKSVYVEHSYMPEIINNQFIENGSLGLGDYGIASVQNVGISITNNKLFRSGAIYLKGTMGAMVHNNISDNPGLTGGDGLSILSTFYSSFQSNVIMGADCYGLWMLHHSEHNIISNNQFFSGITSGIYISANAKNNLLSDNQIQNNYGNGIFLDFTADNNIIEGNLITDNQSRGILIHGANNVIKENTSLNNKIENLKVILGMGNILANNITN